mmetsp:Transcript_49223/g.115949  ORF Transcript_49223/g.115949 Transcript_49223/m.115949 type:complete len:263 (+) Transcript_49223:969-1757(+)
MLPQCGDFPGEGGGPGPLAELCLEQPRLRLQRRGAAAGRRARVPARARARRRQRARHRQSRTPHHLHGPGGGRRGGEPGEAGAGRAHVLVGPLRTAVLHPGVDRAGGALQGPDGHGGERGGQGRVSLSRHGSFLPGSGVGQQRPGGVVAAGALFPSRERRKEGRGVLPDGDPQEPHNPRSVGQPRALDAAGERAVGGVCDVREGAVDLQRLPRDLQQHRQPLPAPRQVRGGDGVLPGVSEHQGRLRDRAQQPSAAPRRARVP